MLYERDSMMGETEDKSGDAALGLNEAHRRRNDLQESEYLRLAARTAAESQDELYVDPEKGFWRYRVKPRWVTIVYGLLAAVLIIGQLWLEELNEALGDPLPYIGLWRFGVFVLGGFCAFIAWPYYVDVGNTRRDPPPRLKARR
jgi:hypothetical protein